MTTTRSFATNVEDRVFLDESDASKLYKPETSDEVAGVEIRKIKALRRWKDGSNHSKWLREKKNLLPGILYGKNRRGKEKRMLIAVPTNQMQSELKKYGRVVHNAIYDVELDGNVQRAILRDFQIHPATEELISVNFMRYHEKKKVRVLVPIEFYNEEKSVGLKRGGLMRVTMRDVELVTDAPNAAGAIPRRIRVSLEGTKLGQRIRAKEMPIPEGFRLIRPDEVALTIIKRKLRGGEVDINAEEAE